MTERPIESATTPAPWAMRAERSRGRRYPEPSHPYRSDYARDRDRIIHSRAFRRLEAKTQVFTTRYSDHFRNRLTHTLEVAQIARSVTSALGLNTELAEALALVHDIGHPPFGHAGERKLDELMRAHGGCFNHNLHALRIVERFEQRYLDFPGLNLTFEVREGIIKHSRDYSAADFPQLAEYLLDLRPPLEAQLIDWVDEIAYNTADTDDALEAGLLDLAVLCKEVSFFGEVYGQVDSVHRGARQKLIFNEALKRVLDALATNLIETTQQRVLAFNASSVEDIRRAPKRLAGFSEAAEARNRELKRFLFKYIYNHPAIAEDRDRSVRCLEELFIYYSESRGAMPAFYEELAQTESRHVIVCDYIAGMTDQFLLRQHHEHLGSPPGDSSTPSR
ncbi:MAG: deoxyguanosinetriphosphate triphosphohydrolase [Acidobacteria bacterium]|nr:MAG: deoxyguanosinetriphosphate triphosphohydrolase [Acidobacteriota bacterium]PYT47437.1 MAG: deoxyguanosinetriphosphate triphosphohydrolase [Acidobacteriota bacterium]